MNRFLVLLVSLLHLLPHPFGVSPVGALALYAGANGDRKTSWAVVALPLLLAAIVFGFYDPVVMAFVFAGFAVASVIGRLLLQHGRSRIRYASAVALGAFAFFVISNFSIWLVGMYPPTAAGLLQCFINGLPYLGQAILADAAYCFLLFGLHALIVKPETVSVTA